MTRETAMATYRIEDSASGGEWTMDCFSVAEAMVALARSRGWRAPVAIQYWWVAAELNVHWSVYETDEARGANRGMDICKKEIES